MFKGFFIKTAPLAGGAEATGKKAWLGRRGEQLAEKYLKKKGYRVLERNFNGRFGELDLIVSKSKVIVFVEVKIRSGTAYGAAKEAVDARKAGRIVKAAKEYMHKKDLPEDTALRFDVIGITVEGSAENLEKSEPIIEHIEAAFEAE